MPDERSLLTDEMRAAVGREFRWITSFPISANEIRRWAMAVYWPGLPPRRFWDEAHAATTPFGGLVAPEDFNPFAWMTASPGPGEGAAPGRPWPEPELGLPDPPARANIIAGMDVEYTGIGMRPGDVVRSVTSLGGYREREGRLGLMLETTTEERWTNQRDELIRTSHIHLLRYR
jgi:hypothetical protein